ncbi:MAG: hypothetical protein ACRDI2_26265, partial [Chloroflexota bacterium]
RRLPSVPGGWDLVLSARPRAAAAPYGDLSAAVDSLFRRGGLSTVPATKGIQAAPAGPGTMGA